MSPKLFLVVVCLIGIAQNAYASEATMPVANQKFISLQSQRNLAYKNRQAPAVPPRFFALNSGQKMIPIGRRPSPQAAQIDAEAPTPRQIANKPATPGTMTREQAHQLLSLFAAAD